MLAHHDGARVRLISRRGLNRGWRFPTIVAAVKALAVHSCIIDGELIACDAGLADFQLLRWRKRESNCFAGVSGMTRAIYCAFDLL
jgi:ATP-dependent DNA ligase